MQKQEKGTATRPAAGGGGGGRGEKGRVSDPTPDLLNQYLPFSVSSHDSQAHSFGKDWDSHSLAAESLSDSALGTWVFCFVFF